MNAKDVIRGASALSLTVVKSYVSDLTDAELLVRPGPGCNHIAWQLGHLIGSEADLLNMICPNAVELPAGFAEKYTKETARSDDPTQFLTRQQYVELFDRINAATLAALDALPDADLDKPGPEPLKRMCPTVGMVFVLIASHPMMHAGQFVPVRRALGKPILI